MTAFVIGNGLSRKGIDLNKLDGTTYGCNWLYTEFRPDVLVATDYSISIHIQNSPYPKYNTFYTRKAYAKSGALQLRSQFKNWASGPNAVQLAVYDKHDTIVLLGFDFGGTENFNNVYAGTQFYKESKSISTYSGSWKHQISKVISMNDSVNFKIVTGLETCHSVNKFNQYKNATIITTDEFCKEYQDNKDHK